MALEEIKKKLKTSLAEGIDRTLSLIEEKVDSSSTVFDDFILIKGQNRKNSDDFLKNIISRDDYNRINDKIRNSILQKINDITDKDLKKIFDLQHFNKKISSLEKENAVLRKENEEYKKDKKELLLKLKKT